MTDQPMDHAAAHERIEDVLIEPARLAALEFSNEPEDVALREHLAGCPTCAADLASWRRLHLAIDAAIPGQSTDAAASAVDPIELPPSLRARIVAAAHAEPKAHTAIPSTGVAQPAVTVDAVVPAPISIDRGRRQPRLAPLLSMAAALVLLVGSGIAVVNQAQQRAAAEASAQDLAVALAAVDRMLEVDHKVVQLRDTSGRAAGTISWSRHDWVVLTNSLATPAAGSTYRCWLIEGGSRSMAVGEMEFSGGLAYWATSVDEWQTFEIGPTTEFIVTLESGAPSAPAGDTVLSARLSS